MVHVLKDRFDIECFEAAWNFKSLDLLWTEFCYVKLFLTCSESELNRVCERENVF